MSIHLENRTALVTGASKGIGKGTALELAVEEIRQQLSPSASNETVAEVQLDSAMAFLRQHTPPE